MPDDALPANLAPGAFSGTAEDYARYRPPYPSALLDRLLSLTPGRNRILDLACGPGRIALAVASSFDDVLAVDLEPDMLAVGRRLAAERGAANITWQRARAEDLQLPAGTLDLITIGEAFHRLDRREILDLARAWLKPGGILATMGGRNILRGSQPWHVKVFEVADEWTRDAFPQGWAPALPGSETDRSGVQRLLESHGFVGVTDFSFAQKTTWTIDDVLGYLRSMSVCSPAILGARRPAFEAEVRAALRELSADGQFHEDLKFELTVATRP